MSINKDIPTYEPERLEEIMKAARQERAEAVKQLFGFGFSVVKEKFESSLERVNTTTSPANGAARSL